MVGLLRLEGWESFSKISLHSVWSWLVLVMSRSNPPRFIYENYLLPDDEVLIATHPQM